MSFEDGFAIISIDRKGIPTTVQMFTFQCTSVYSTTCILNNAAVHASLHSYLVSKAELWQESPLRVSWGMAKK